MNKHLLLRLLLLVALLSAVVPLSLDVAARPEQSSSHAAFNQLQAAARGDLAVSWDAQSDVTREYIVEGKDLVSHIAVQTVNLR